jgi:uncharacterized protein (DUF58 family)
VSDRVRPSEEGLREAARWVLSLEHVPRGGASGDALGRGTGSSMEFHDRRPYAPGDDVRHIDWRAMAKTNEVLVRVHQEEVAPRLDPFVDVSKSMATEPAKAQRTVDLAAVLSASARAAGYAVRIVALGDRIERVSSDQLMADGLAFTSSRPLGDLVGEAGGEARPASLRVLVSDFLVPADPVRMAQPFARGAGRIALLQVLSRRDAEPVAMGALRLLDAERDEIREVVVDRAALRRYGERLERLQAGLAEAAQRHGGQFVSLRSDATLAQGLEALAARGILG